MPTPRRYQQKNTAQPDAVNETVRLNSTPKKESYGESNIREMDRQSSEYKRLRYYIRQQLSNYARDNNQLDMSWLMTDADIDNLIQDMQYRIGLSQLPQHQLRETIDTERLADYYAALSSTYARLGSPAYMPMVNPIQIAANPELAEQQFYLGMSNPAYNILQIAAPTGAGIGVARAAKGAYQAAKATGAGVARGVGQAVKAAGRAAVEHAPQIAANTVMIGTPMAAAASNDASFTESFLPYFIGGSLLFGGGYGVSRLLSKASKKPKWLSWWERDPYKQMERNKRNQLKTEYNEALLAQDQAALDKLKEKVGYSPKEYLESGSRDPKYINNYELATTIKSEPLPLVEGRYIGAQVGRHLRNWAVRFPLYSASLGGVGYGIGNWLSGNDPEPTIQPGPAMSPTVQTSTLREATPTRTDITVVDTVPAIPAVSDSTYTPWLNPNGTVNMP